MSGISAARRQKEGRCERHGVPLEECPFCRPGATPLPRCRHGMLQGTCSLCVLGEQASPPPSPQAAEEEPPRRRPLPLKPPPPPPPPPPVLETDGGAPVPPELGDLLSPREKDLLPQLVPPAPKLPRRKRGTRTTTATAPTTTATVAQARVPARTPSGEAERAAPASAGRKRARARVVPASTTTATASTTTATASTTTATASTTTATASTTTATAPPAPKKLRRGRSRAEVPPPPPAPPPSSSSPAPRLEAGPAPAPPPPAAGADGDAATRERLLAHLARAGRCLRASLHAVDLAIAAADTAPLPVLAGALASAATDAELAQLALAGARGTHPALRSIAELVKEPG